MPLGELSMALSPVGHVEPESRDRKTMLSLIHHPGLQLAAQQPGAHLEAMALHSSETPTQSELARPASVLDARALAIE